MNKLFATQLIVSFVVGGGVIALLSFIAEKAHNRIAGIILAFPTTAALGFFFLGWTLSPKAVANIVPSTLIPLGLSVLFAAVYAYVANYLAKTIKSKIWQIIATFIISIGFWFALATPIIVLEINHLALGIAGYALLILTAHLLLQRKNYPKPVTVTYTLGQKIARSTFVGFIVFLVVLLGKLLNPFWGGMFAMFPAAFSSLLMILHWYYDPKSLFPTMQKVALGSLSLFAYAITTMLLFPKFGFIIGTLLAYAVSLAVTLLLMKLQPKAKEIMPPPSLMKSKILILLSIIIMAGLSVISYFFITETTLKKSIIENDGDYVVLLHGLGRSSWSMQKIGKHLSGEGYKVININYPTKSDTIENLTETYLKNELEHTYIDRTKRISFVTHSMGGIMARYFLANNELANIHRVVMLAPPNKGSETADKWAHNKIMSYIMGPAIQEMTTNEKSLANTLPSPDYEVGIVAGEHDEKVSVERTKLENMKDFLIVQREHTYIMQSDEVLHAIEQFLQKGKF